MVGEQEAVVVVEGRQGQRAAHMRHAGRTAARGDALLLAAPSSEPPLDASLTRKAHRRVPAPAACASVIYSTQRCLSAFGGTIRESSFTAILDCLESGSSQPTGACSEEAHVTRRTGLSSAAHLLEATQARDAHVLVALCARFAFGSESSCYTCRLGDSVPAQRWSEHKSGGASLSRHFFHPPAAVFRCAFRDLCIRLTLLAPHPASSSLASGRQKR
jgi:hypothetical protein